MLPKCIVLFIVIVAVKSATLQGRNIPVEVRYEGVEYDAGSNFEEKIQLSGEEIKENNLRLQKLSTAEENLIPANNHNFIKNFNEKVQLSPEELQQSSKHIPIDLDDQTNENWEALGELRGKPLSESNSEILNKAAFIRQAQEIVDTGLKNLRENFKPKCNEKSPSNEDWEKLEKNLNEYFVEETGKLELRQEKPTQQPTSFQSIITGIQQVLNNFIEGFQGQSGPNKISEAERQAPPQQQGPFQEFVGYFTGGVQNIVSNIQNIGQNFQQGSGNSTVLGDNGTGGNQPGNFIGTIVTNVQQLFQGQIPGISQGTGGNGTQGDNPGNEAGLGIFGSAISQFNQVVGNFVPTSSQKPPAAEGDEGSNNPAPNQPGGPFQQVVQSFGNIGTAINQFIQGAPQQNKPQGSEDENASNQPPNQNFIQSIGQNVGNAIQSIQNQFRPPQLTSPNQASGSEGSNSGSSNPIVGQVTNLGNQIQQIAGQQAGTNPIQNLIPGSSSSSSEKPIKARSETTLPEEDLSTTETLTHETTEPGQKIEVMTATE